MSDPTLGIFRWARDRLCRNASGRRGRGVLWAGGGKVTPGQRGPVAVKKDP